MATVAALAYQPEERTNARVILGGSDFYQENSRHDISGPSALVFPSPKMTNGSLRNFSSHSQPVAHQPATINEIIPVFNKAVMNLLKVRDHLLLQLNLEYGNISEKDFEREESAYLRETEKIPLEKLQEEVRILLAAGSQLDALDISEILNCPIDDAEQAIDHYVTRFKHAGT